MMVFNFRSLGGFEIFSRSKLYRMFGKRVFDIALTLSVMPIVLPIMVILALLVALDRGHPFYSQSKVGKKGRLYQVWKLRSTVKYAGSRHEADGEPNHIPDLCLTKLGRFLQISSFDELPLFFNVLIGHMSLVGPQPISVSQKAHYYGGDYCDLRPGLTGPWLISTQHHMTLNERAACDAQYNQSMSFTSDLSILAATTKAAMRRN